jgi:hypothetical protein
VPDSTVSTELVRRVRNQPPQRLTDYRDSKVPGFVLRARPSGVHSWRVQLPDRQWLTLGRVDEVSLADARDEAQQRRAKAALGLEIAGRRSKSEITLARFLDEQYEPWMKATRRSRSPATRHAASGPGVSVRHAASSGAARRRSRAPTATGAAGCDRADEGLEEIVGVEFLDDRLHERA